MNATLTAVSLGCDFLLFGKSLPFTERRAMAEILAAKAISALAKRIFRGFLRTQNRFSILQFIETKNADGGKMYSSED